MTKEFIPNVCACMGPQGKDPHCPCKMRSLGLQPSNTWSKENKDKLTDAFTKMFGWKSDKAK